MDILERVRTDLHGASVARQREVADAIGIPWSTLRKIIDKDTENPRYDTVLKLREYYLSAAERAAESNTIASPQQAAWHGRERRRQLA